ncbi:MAG: hypothetical protein FWB88_03200 [Defluviitaleaceae bacterium]|nr:hypothetical protein [Defluviitaleaceae bacterium]MCL2238443.1 hypothetical protein [Defluviitaleaceae bacterium]
MLAMLYLMKLLADKARNTKIIYNARSIKESEDTRNRETDRICDFLGHAPIQLNVFLQIIQMQVAQNVKAMLASTALLMKLTATNIGVALVAVRHSILSRDYPTYRTI